MRIICFGGVGLFKRTISGGIVKATIGGNMNDGIPIDPNRIHFEDECIVLRIRSFDPETGQGTYDVEDIVAHTRMYWITLHFTSGNEIKIQYDAANPNRNQESTFNASYRNDAIVDIDVIVGRPSSSI